MALRAVLFDLDDTLVSRHQALAVFAERFAQRFAAELGEVAADTVEAAIREADDDGYRARPSMCSDLLRRLSWRRRPGVDDLLAYWETEFSRCMVAAPGVHEVLASLRAADVRTAIVTNGMTAMQNAKIDFLGLRPLVDAVVISESVGVWKPDPRIFHLALDLLAVDRTGPTEAWFVGDNPVNDVLGAIAAGLTGVWLSGPLPWPADKERPSLKIGSLYELLPLLAEHLQ